MNNLVLIGFMGTGKTTVGRLCARRMGRRFCDSDRVIEQQAGCSIPQLFASQGEAAFRKLEKRVIEELSAQENLVIATGGGVAMNPENVAHLQAGGTVVLLSAAPEEILGRVGNARNRPLLASASSPEARIRQLLEERETRYAEAAHHRVETTGRRPADIAHEIVRLLEGE